jgi:hypothetical protein
MKSFDSPDTFYNSIPKGINENLEFRRILHTSVEKDTGLQKVYLSLIKQNLKIAFNSMLWTQNPRLSVGYRNQPFILRPRQEILVDALTDCIHIQKDFGINKSRDEGATECVTKVFALLSFLEKDGYFIVGSRVKELVDCAGDPYTLFAKIDQVFNTIPPWLTRLIGIIDRKDMQLSIPSTNSVIKGETTNESFSAGRRSTAIFLDEFGRVEPRVAESIEGSVHDVTGCVVYGSTHWFGETHPFNKALKKATTKVINLVWYENPEKSAGLYKTPDYDKIEIIDKQYYLKNYPEIFNANGPWDFKLSELEKNLLSRGYSGSSPKFIADKCENLPNGADYRSPWHDKEEERRKGNLRDFISNIWASPIGSQDSVFSPIVLSRIESSTISVPKYMGEIMYDRTDEGTITNIYFSNGGKKRLKWWGELNNSIPNRSHNYVLGCDISLGTGNSNSVAAIYDANTNEIIGSWVCANTPCEQFADVVTALATWLGNAFIVFENNGGHGINFGRRLIKNKYYRVYTQHSEENKTRQMQNKWGWTSTNNSKSDVLGELGIALSEGLKKNPTYTACIIHDEDILSELRQYVFYENGDIGASECQDLTSGARKRHGDRVIGVALCVLGSKYQAKAPKIVEEKSKVGTFAERLEKVEEQDEEERRYRRSYRF